MKSLHDRFWEKVKVGKPDECWEWLGAKTGGKHPHAIFKGPDTRSAYRQLFIWQHGPIDRALDICHSCDNGMCVNPRHLSTGSRSENMRQCVERGRFTPPPPHKNHSRGEAVASHKLTDDPRARDPQLGCGRRRDARPGRGLRRRTSNYIRNRKR